MQPRPLLPETLFALCSDYPTLCTCEVLTASDGAHTTRRLHNFARRRDAGTKGITLGRRGASGYCCFSRTVRERIAPRTRLRSTADWDIGLLLWVFRGGSPERNIIRLPGGIEFELHTPAFVVMAFGVVLVIISTWIHEAPPTLDNKSSAPARPKEASSKLFDELGDLVP